MTTTDETRRISRAGRLVGGAVATAAAVAGLFVATASPAFAATSWSTQSNGVGGVYGWGYWAQQSDGRCHITIWVKDTRADGHRAGVDFKNSELMFDEHRYFENTGGSGTTERDSYTIFVNNFDNFLYVREYISEGPMGDGGHFVGDPGGYNRICT